MLFGDETAQRKGSTNESPGANGTAITRGASGGFSTLVAARARAHTYLIFTFFLFISPFLWRCHIQGTFLFTDQVQQAVGVAGEL